MSKINKEIEEMATKLEKASADPKEKLFSVIKALGPEGLKGRIATLSDDEKVVLKAALEELSLQKAISFDKEAAGAKMIVGKSPNSITEEEIANDDADEKLVKPEAAKFDHQGTPTDGWSGQVIKSINESEELMDKIVSTLLEKGMKEEECETKCEKKGLDKKKVQGAIEKFKKAKAMPKDKEADKTEKKDEKKKEEPKADKPMPFQKSVSWEEPNHLIKANTLGRNYTFNVGDFIDNMLKAEPTEEVTKSSVAGDLNEIIAKSEDQTWEDVEYARMIAENAKKKNGQLVKSFDEKDVAELYGISEEDAKKILGE